MRRFITVSLGIGMLLAGALIVALMQLPTVSRHVTVGASGQPVFPVSPPRRMVSTADPARRARIARALPNVERKRERLADGPKRFDEPQAAMDFFLQQRLAPGQTQLPLEKLHAQLQAVRARQTAMQASRSTPALTGGVGTWTELGPGNIGGRTRAIAIDPTNTNVVYAGGVAGGIWKSTDRGATWQVADDLMLNLAVVSIVIDPNNTNVLYAGTGEGYFNSDATRGLGIFKSTDAGATWSQLAGTVEPAVPFGAFFRVNDIVISPADSNRLYAATRFGVWRSTDAGSSWTNVLANPNQTGGAPASNGSFVGCTELAVRGDTGPDPNNDVIFAAFGSFTPDGLFRSTDGGTTWSQLGTASDLNVANQGRMALAIAPSDNNVIYVCMSDNGDVSNPTGTVVNVLRSMDGGNTWSNRLSFAGFEQFLLSNVPFGNGCFGSSFFSQGWYDNVIAVDPTNSDTVWVGGVDLFRSADGGQNFELASYWYFASSDPEFAHADQHAIVFDPNYDGAGNQTVFVGNDGGIFISTNAAAPASTNGCPAFDPGPLPSIRWQNLNNGYGVTQFYDGDAAPQSPIYMGGAQDNGTMSVQSAATPDNWASIFGGDGGYVAINPVDTMVQYAETQFFPNIIKSIDGGASFAVATNGITDGDGLFITPFVMDPSDPNVLWSGGTRPWRTTDGAANWTLANVDTAGFSGQISAIAASPDDGNVVYMGLSDGSVVVTTNGLSVAPPPSWVQYGGANGLPFGFVSDVAVSPGDPRTAYVTYSTFFGSGAHVFRTTDGGVSWTSIDGSVAATGVPEIPVHSIAVRPCNTNQLYVGTELGVFATDDGGATWSPVNTGLANTVVEELTFQGNGDVLVAFTHGRGAFRAGLTTCDCNSNGIFDTAEIAAGSASDCNSNTVLDACETVGGDDFDNDGDVDLGDLAAFADCHAGPVSPPTPTDPACVQLCLDAFDDDLDADVDLADFAAFSIAFTGP